MSLTIDNVLFTNKGRNKVDVIAANPSNFKILSFVMEENRFFWSEIDLIEQIEIGSYQYINFCSGNTVNCSLNHQLYNTQIGFTPASLINSLDYCAGMSRFELVAISDPIHEAAVAYNIKLKDSEVYFVNGLLVSESS